MTKKYTLTTSEETVTENPEDIIRLMKLAGLTNAQPVAEEEVTEEVEAEVYEPTEANDKLDLDDYSKKSPESINKQKKSIQPTLGDNPLEYSLDENEIYEAMMKEFKETEEVSEAQSPAQKAAFAKMLAAKDGKKDEAVEEKEETDELKEEELKEDCSCGHGSDCTCGPECDCGCNESVNEERVDEIVPLIIGGLARAAIGSVAKKAIGGAAKAAVGTVSNAASNSINASKKSKYKPVKTENNMEQERLKELSGIKEDNSLTAGTIKKLQHLVNTQHDVYAPDSDIFGMFGSPYTAEEWLSHMKLTIDEVFTKEGSPVPPEVAKVYNDLEAYSRQTELQAKRRANTDKNASNDAIYGPENEDELYIRDNFAEQWYDAFYKVESQLGLEYDEDFDESINNDKLSGINEDKSLQDAVNESQERLKYLIGR